MILTHTNSVYSEELTLLDSIPYPQYVHQVGNGGGPMVTQGIKLLTGELVNYVLKGQHGAAGGTYTFINDLMSIPTLKVGLIIASGSASWTGYTSTVPKTSQYPAYKIVPMAVTQVYAGYIAGQLGSFDYIATDSVSCISGHSAWYTAYNLLALERLDAVVVIAVDNGLSEEYLHVFGEHKLSKLLDEEDDPNIIKFHLGQACNISVFESLYSVLTTKHLGLAEIKDIYVAAEYHNSPLGISCKGTGYKKVMNRVNTHSTSKLDFIKTHSTFSKDNEIEDILIKEQFGDIRTIDYKLRIGHTMGVSTAVETALAIQEESGRFLSLGAGMGNVYSSAIVEIL
jgi:3-oxoacyl-(acyl-carrier-protein) synthase